MTFSPATSDFVDVRPLWLSILAQSEWSSVFLTPEWQETWWTEFGEASELQIITIGPDESPIGIAPLILRDGCLTFLGATDLFDYHDFITTDATFYELFFQKLEDKPWRSLDLASIPNWSPTFLGLPKAARARGYLVETQQEDVVPGIPLPNSWDEYLTSLRKKDRHELRRKLRRLDSAGDVRVRLATASTLAEDIEIFHAVMAESKEEKREFLSPGRKAFFASMTRAMHDAGYLRLFMLELDGEPTAAVIAFDYAGRRLLYNSGYRQDYAPLAVGLMLKALTIKDSIERGLSYFDLLRGDEPYKYHLGAVDSTIHRIVVRR